MENMEKKASLLHQRLTKELNEPQAIHDYYRKIISCMPNNVYWLDRNCIAQGCNENVLKLFGLHSLDQFIGITYEEMGRLAGWTEGQAESFKRDDIEVMATGIAKYNVEEPPLYNEKGTLLYYMSSRVPIFNEEGQVIGVIGISVDITERKKNEEALKEALEDAKVATIAKTAFLANISHDVKTPLAGAISSAEYLAEVIADPELKKRADNIYKSGLRLYDLIEELIEVSRLGVEPAVKKRVRFKFKDVIDDLIDLIKPAIEDKSLTLEIKYENELPNYLIGNRTYLSRVLLNLLSNAIKFTKQGGIRVGIGLEKKNKKEVVVKVNVQDTGIGIPKDKTQVIFDKFTRLVPSYEGKYEGSGLGLYIVKEFIEAMDGEIYVKSEVGKGSQFTILVPLKIALSQSEDEFENPTEDVHQQTKPALSIIKPLYETVPIVHEASQNAEDSPITLRALLVEDEVIAAYVAKDILQLFGCKVDVVNSGENAIKQFEVGKYDLIFMDVGLPGISGIEAAKQIRRMEESSEKQIPIIALSAHVDSSLCLSAGMNTVLVKPLLKIQAEKIVSEQKNLLLKTKKDRIEEKELKVIDLELCASLIHSNIEGAKKTLKLFMEESLPVEKQEIVQAYNGKDMQKLVKAVHKMHGSLCYCGVPRLKNAIKNLENTLKINDLKQLDKVYSAFNFELATFIEVYKTL